MYIVQRALTFVRGFLLSYGPTKIKKALWDKEFLATNGTLLTIQLATVSTRI